MELRQLTYFLAAAQTQNFRKAAEMCIIAQPALSRQIAALEAELGVQLFLRVKQRVFLTAEGEEFAGYARAALDQLQQGQQAMARLQDGKHGTVHIGCIEPLTTAFLPMVLPAFHQQYPHIQLKVQVGHTDELLTRVEQGSVDLGLVFNPSKHPEVLVINELFRQPLQVLVAANHPLARRAKKTIPLSLLQHEQLFLLGETSRLRRAVARLFERHNLTMRVAVEIESVAGLKELVRQGQGISFMLKTMLEPNEIGTQFTLLSIDDNEEEFAFALVYHRFGQIPLQARHFINCITHNKTDQ
ncbi:MAG TPA: LysR family transcriptional regulator [Dictyobacter sp.]|nr:LysR family transcriptional regulator [Dictyobacter sp.]